MKKNRIFCLASTIALLVAGACSNEMIDQKKDPGQLSPDDGSGGVYMTVDFKLPNGLDGTRSETIEGGGSDAGTEVGTPAENNVTSALIVLAFDETDGILAPVEGLSIEKYGYIVAGEVFNNHITHVGTTDNSSLVEATAKLNKENLNKLYGLFYNETNSTYSVPPVHVFVFCNPTQELRALFAAADGGNNTLQFGSASWINKTCTVIQHDAKDQDKNIGIWSPNSFLMNNKDLTTRELPKKLLDWENYSSYDKAFHLSAANELNGKVEVDNSSTVEGRGAVLVERSVARLDLKDGSDNGNSHYNVLFGMDKQGDIVDKAPIAGVQLQKMCLVNMGNQFYYLPRVSENGQLDGPDYQLCGREKPWIRNNTTGNYTGGNYVVGPYASVFKNAASDFGYDDNESDQKPPLGNPEILLGGKKISEYFNFPFFNNDGSYNQDMKIGSQWDVVKISDILSNGDTDNYNNKHEYNVWRYVVENVIPAGTENQVNGISTGIIFKAQIVPPVTAGNIDYSEYEYFWNKGYVNNLINCLSGKTFTYNGSDHTLQGNSTDDPILYYKDAQLYMGWRHIRQAAIQESIIMDVSGKLEINDNTDLYRAVFGEGPIPPGNVYQPGAGQEPIEIKDPKWLDDFKVDGTSQNSSAAYQNYLNSANFAWEQWQKAGKKPEEMADMRKAITGAGITIYQSSTDEDSKVPGYYCYYYYWNRHNDNHLNGSMGPMEFDVVRNNVYKLSVDKVSRLGHPRIPENDPNNPTPGTKDESDDIYLDVEVQIAPWVVRLNSIQF